MTSPKFLVRQLPFRHALQHAAGVIDRIHMPAVLLDHVDGGSHLPGKEINVYAFLQAERGIGAGSNMSGAARPACLRANSIRSEDRQSGNCREFLRACR
jgi:hypothetical protein